MGLMDNYSNYVKSLEGRLVFAIPKSESNSYNSLPGRTAQTYFPTC